MNIINAFSKLLEQFFQFSKKSRDDKEGKKGVIFEGLEAAIWEFGKVSGPR